MSRQDRIRERKRQEFRDRQQYNRIVGQLNALKGAGFTNEQISGAGNNAFAALGGVFENGQYVVKDSDTLESIASANGTNVNDILNKNPDMKSPQTGMVINLPGNWQGSAFAVGGSTLKPPSSIGLPSNGPIGAAQGSLTTFKEDPRVQDVYRPSAVDQVTAARQARQQGFSNAISNFFNRNSSPNAMVNTAISRAANGSTPNLPTWQQQAANRASPFNAWQQYNGSIPGGFGTIAEAAQLYSATRNPQTSPFNQAINAMVNRTPDKTAPATPVTPPIATPAPTVPRPPAGLPTTYPGGFRRWVGEEMAQINNPAYTPNEVTVRYLQQLGLIEQTKPQTVSGGGGGFSYRRRGGGGRGGGRGRGGGGGGGGGEPRLPAFSSGSGNMGLINWRI